MPESHPEFREHVRVAYPEGERPRLVLGREVCEVLDFSERGIRFQCSFPPLPGSRIHGRLRWVRLAEVRLRGTVLRVRGSEVAVRLDEPGVPFAAVLAEHLHLRGRGGAPR